MKRLTLISFVFLFALAGCRTTDTMEADFPCTCGTPEAAMESCLHPLCSEGEGNPDNPDCVCGTLSFEKEE